MKGGCRPPPRPLLTGGVGSAGRLLQAPRVWLGLCWVVAQGWGGAAGLPEAGKRSLVKNTRLSLHRSLTSFSSLLRPCGNLRIRANMS